MTLVAQEILSGNTQTFGIKQDWCNMAKRRNIKLDLVKVEVAEKQAKRARGFSARPRSERRLAARLQKIPKDWICRTCNKLVLSKRSWVVLNNIAQCRSCYFKNLEVNKRINETNAPKAEVAESECK